LIKEELNTDDGLQKIIQKLKELYSVTEDQAQAMFKEVRPSI